ncbi:hypothetical protein AW895_14005 [Pseudomonas aeruginosa]|nr:hypothetical protein HW11_24455 [Pseudomonas aeruginosa]KEA30448.1 hypothetical protein BH79_09645 [Pseudomonas aeruginosa C0324C]AMX91172.1 hypothetical protein A4W92_30410 [Pseudomonas aeruginosa]ANT76351.1 hypothetical protein ACG06_13830 [Pseudomonas aeruginosa]KXC58709.1 hypothetical protein AW894_13470 [Pseudomonas aeruginosa]
MPAGILVCLGQECGALLQPLQVVIAKLLPELWRSGQLLQSCIGFPPVLDQLINTHCGFSCRKTNASSNTYDDTDILLGRNNCPFGFYSGFAERFVLAAIDLLPLLLLLPMTEVVVLGGIPRHPGSRLQALGVRIALRRSRQHADQLRTHDQQALLVIDGQAGVLLGEAIHQRLVDSRSQGSGTEIATDRFGGQTSHQGVQADLAEAAVVQYAMGGGKKGTDLFFLL